MNKTSQHCKPSWLFFYWLILYAFLLSFFLPGVPMLFVILWGIVKYLYEDEGLVQFWFLTNLCEGCVLWKGVKLHIFLGYNCFGNGYCIDILCICSTCHLISVKASHYILFKQISTSFCCSATSACLNTHLAGKIHCFYVSCPSSWLIITLGQPVFKLVFLEAANMPGLFNKTFQWWH